MTLIETIEAELKEIKDWVSWPDPHSAPWFEQYQFFDFYEKSPERIAKLIEAVKVMKEVIYCEMPASCGESSWCSSCLTLNKVDEILGGEAK